jgi:5-methylcytosine-specific restriction endonuclease McrA
MKYTAERMSAVVAKSNSLGEVIDALGLKRAGGNYTHLKRVIEKHGISTDHFKGKSYNAGRVFENQQKPIEKVFVVRPAGSNREKAHILRRSMVKVGIPYKCNKCGLTDSWQNDTLTLEVDHINDDWLDNRLQNLQFLCPNCHSQKPNHSRNKYAPVSQR